MTNLLFDPEILKNYKYDQKSLNSPGAQALLSNASFKNQKDSLAILGCGGTISSVYSPLHESIHATNHSPTMDLLVALHDSFGLAEDDITYLPLINKDSREVTSEDVNFLLDMINGIENERIIVTFGTFGVQTLTKVIADNIKVKNKIIITTGSMLPSAFREQDADVNGLAAVASANTVHALRNQENTEFDSVVLCTFHGGIFSPGECIDLDLHPASHKNVKFYRGVRFRTE